jgi:hypothetical protein
MDTALHQLCDVCSKLRLRLHTRPKCRISCKAYAAHYKTPDFDGPHSGWIRHHDNWAALNDSAKIGCHLCILFAFAMKDKGQDYNLSKGLPDTACLVFYTSKEGVLTYDREALPSAKGNLLVVCEGRGPQRFEVVEYPDTQCAYQKLEGTLCGNNITPKPLYSTMLSLNDDYGENFGSKTWWVSHPAVTT